MDLTVLTPAAPGRKPRIEMIFNRLALNAKRHPDISFEYIIVDDSLDAEYKELSQCDWPFDVKYVSLPLTEPYPNPSYMRNVGFRIAQGEIFTMIDADHWVHEDFVEGALEPYKDVRRANDLPDSPPSILNTGFMIDTSKGNNWAMHGVKINNELIAQADDMFFKTAMNITGINGPVLCNRVWLAAYPGKAFLDINGYDEHYVTGYCYDKTVEVLTKEGYKLIKNVQLQEKIWTLNPNTHCGEWQEVQKKYEYDYDGQMYRFKNLLMDLSVTPDHKMWIKNGRWKHIKAKDIKTPSNYRSSQHCSSVRLACENDSSEILDKMQQSLIKFIAYYISEGHYRKNQIQIAKDPKVYPNQHKEIVDTISHLGYKVSCSNHTITICNKNFADKISEMCGRGSQNKKIPPLIFQCNQAYQKLFIETLISCDGDQESRYATTSKMLYNQLMQLAPICGFWISENKSKDATDKWNQCFLLKIVERKGAKLREGQIATYSYKDKIYCLTVPNHIILVKSNGKTCYSGQSREDDDIYFRLRSYLVTVHTNSFNKFAGVHLWHPQGARNQAMNELNKKYYSKVAPDNYVRNATHEWGKFVKGSYSIIGGTQRSFVDHEFWIRDHTPVDAYILNKPWKNFKELRSQFV